MIQGKQHQRLIEFGAVEIHGERNRRGRTAWTGLIPCKICGVVRRVNSHGIGLKSYTGKCLSCTAKENVKHANAPDAYRANGKRHHLYKNGFTINDSGYRIASLHRNHPFRVMADRHGRIREHRLIMAEHLDRPLEPWEVVHHKNGDKSDNRLENLEIVATSVHTFVTKMEQEIHELKRENERLRGCLSKLQSSRENG